MAVKELIEEIETDVNDVFSTTFEYTTTNQVPSRSDTQLTFERAIAKKGKILTTCVLYVDIRNSVELTRTHSAEVMGKIYTTFAKSVLKIAKHHSGHIRNIIGDRVMIIFPSANCFTNAVDCAISINHVAQYLINKKFTTVEFKCGIGIDYGPIKVIKVGVQRRGHEGTENRSLIWVGNPANIASRLTDVANKSTEETYFEVLRNPINPRAIRPLFGGLTAVFGGSPVYDPNAPLYLNTTETVEMTPEKFANSMRILDSGEIYMIDGKLINFEKKKRTISFPNILMTGEVFEGFKNANPTRKDIREDYWKLQTNSIKNVSDTIYGGNVHWDIK